MKYVILATAILLANVGVFALPQGGRIESGKGNLDNPAHIIQESQHLQTRWNSFDIAAKEQVRIEQPNAQASINIKVRNGGGSGAGGATTINGTLTANGRVSLENPAGIQFGKNSVVNVGGLLASSAKGAVTSLGQVSAAEVVRFQGLSGKSIVNVGGNVSAQEIIVESNGDIVIGNSAHFTASKQILIGGGYQGKDSSVLNAQTTDVKAAAQINAPRVIVWSDKETSFLGRINAGRGFVEVSGKKNLIFPDISRATAGTLLLDPENISIIAASAGGDVQITGDGILRADESSGTVELSASAIENYVGNVSLAATGQILLQAAVTKDNGSLMLSANSITLSAPVTISGAGNYLSFELTGTSVSTSFTFNSGSRIIADDVRLDINYTTAPLFFVPTVFAAPGRSVTITDPAHANGKIAFSSGFNLCQADNTGCGDLIINAGNIIFINKTDNTIRAKSINITINAYLSLVGDDSNVEFHAHDGDISLTATGGDTISSASNQSFNFSATKNISFSNVGVEIGVGAMTLTAGLGAASAGSITLTGSSFTILSSLSLSQDKPFSTTQPFLSSSAPVTATYRGFGSQPLIAWGRLIYQNVTPRDLNVSDGDLATALVGKFDVPGNILDLGSFNLTATTVALEIPAHIHTIITTGTISIMSGLMSPVMVLNLNAGTFAFGGTFTVGNILTLTSYNPVMANSDLTISASLILDVPSLGSAGFDLTLVGIDEFAASLELLGKNITLNGVITTNNNSALTVTADNDIAVNANILAGTISLEAKAGGTTFASSSTVITAPTINLTQADTYVVSAPANFSATPILNSSVLFVRPSWGICGTNCLDSIVPADLFIIDGDLATALIGKFDASSGTLDLGSFNLTATTVALDIPPSIHTITTTGTISITSGLTATAAAGLNLTAGTFAFGGTLTTDNNILTLTSANPITASSALTISSPLIFSAPSLGSASFDLTLVGISLSNAVELRGFNIQLSDAVTINSSALTITAANDIAVSNAITVGALALTATAGGITFASTAVAASSIELTQADPYAATVSATFSTTPTLNRPTPFNRPSWGLCGTNCFDPTDLVITDGDLTTALVDKFYLSGSTLDLGSFNLTANTVALDIPSHITAITTTGTINIASGLTATAATVGLNLTAGTMTLGGTLTTDTTTLTLTSANPITARSALTVSSPLTLSAPSLGSAGFDLTLAAVTSLSALDLRGSNITLNGAVTAPTIALTQAAAYAAIAPTTFSTTPILNSPNRFNRPSWGLCGTNCLDPTDLVITNGNLTTALVGRFNVSGNTLDLGSLNLVANTTALDIPSHITTITTTGMISITDGLTATVGLNLTAGTFVFGGTLTTDTNTLTLTSANPITARSALTINSPLALSAPSLGSVSFDLTLAAVTSSSALELRGSNIMLGGAVTAPRIALTQAAAYAAIAPTTFSTVPTLNSPNRFNRPSWGLCGTNCLDPTDLAITDGDLTTALVDKFDVLGGTLDLGSFNLTANTTALDIPSHITAITTTGMISITDGLTATAALQFTADMMAFGGTLTTNTLTLTSANPITASSALTVSSPLALSAASLGSVSFDLTLAAVTSLSALELRGSNITLNGAVAAPRIALTQAAAYAAIAPTTFSTTPILNSPTRFNRPSWGLCGTNCLDPTDLVITDGDLTTALVDKFDLSGSTLDLGSFNLVANTVALDIPSHILSITTTGMISITDGLTATAAAGGAGLNLTAGTMAFGGTLTTNTLTLNSANPITARSALTINSPLALSAPSLGSASFDLTLAAVTSLSALELLGSNITLNGAVTAPRIELTQAAAYAAIAPTTFSTTPILNSPTRFNRPSWGLCGTNCFDPTDLVITDGNLTTALVDKFYLSSGTLDLGSFNLTANTVALVIPSHILSITTTGTISITSGLTATAAAGLTLTADTMAFGGTLTTNTLTLNSANPIIASSALTVSSPLTLSAPSLGSVGFDLTLAAVTSPSALELRGSNITLNGAVTAPRIALTQAAAYAAIAPTTFSTTPILNSPTRFNRPSWGLCGTNCLDPTDLVITDGNLTTALVDKFDLSGSTLDLGSLNLVANTVALDIPSHILSITTTGMISITSGLTATAAAGLTLTADTMAFGGTLTTNTLTLTSANPITASSALTVSSPLTLSAPSLGSASFDLTLAGVTSSSALELRGSNITLGGVVTASSSATVTAANDLAVNNTITAATLALIAAAGGITFATTSTAVTGSTIELTQADSYVAIAPATFSTPPTLNRPTIFSRPSWGVCGTNCFGPGDLVVTDGALAAALVGRFNVSGNTLDLGSFNLVASTTALVIPSSITTITTTGMISIMDGLTATAAAGLTLNADTMVFGGTLTTNTLTLNSANPITASSALTINSPLALSAASLGSVSFDLTLAAVTSSSALELRGSNITLNGAVTAPRIELTQAAAYAAIAPTTFSTVPILNSPNPFIRPSWGLCGTNCFDPANLIITNGNLATALIGRFNVSGGTLDLGNFNLTANTVALVIPSGITVITTTGTISITSGLTTTTATVAAGLNLNADAGLTVGGSWELGANALALTTGTGAIVFNSNPTITASRIELTQTDIYDVIAPAVFSTLPILNSATRFTRPSWGLCGINCVDPANMLTSSSMIQLLGNNITLGGVATNSFELTMPASDDIAVNSANGWRPCFRAPTSGQNYFCYH